MIMLYRRGGNPHIQNRRYHGKMERVKRGKEKVLGGCRSHGGHRRSRLGYWLVVLATFCIIAGCTTLKKAGVTSLATGAAVTVATALSSGATVPILAATTTAFVASAVTDATMSESRTILQTGAGMIECAPDNLWSLLEKLVGVGGWFLILIFVVPMILGWILPGPLERKRKQKNLFS